MAPFFCCEDFASAPSELRQELLEGQGDMTAMEKKTETTTDYIYYLGFSVLHLQGFSKQVNNEDN